MGGTEMNQFRDAAYARKSNVRAPADRPSRRHNRDQTSGPARVLAPSTVLMRDGATEDTIVYDGFASVTGREYEMYDMFGPYMEIVHVGAFAESLSTDGLDVPLVLGHDPMRRIARTVNAQSTLTLTEVTEGERTGLRVLAPQLDRADPDVRYIEPKLRSGLIDEMSFRFRIVSGRWSDDWDQYHIHAVDIHRGDVSIVGYGANPHTEGSGLRSGTLPLTRSASYYRARIALDN